MSLPKDMIALPREVGPEWAELKENRWLKFYKIDYPNCIQHKDYPRCLCCNQKYVPIDKEDIWCFKCKWIRT